MIEVNLDPSRARVPGEDHTLGIVIFFLIGFAIFILSIIRTPVSVLGICIGFGIMFLAANAAGDDDIEGDGIPEPH